MPLSADELAYLADNAGRLDPAARHRVMSAMKVHRRGFRSNRYIDALFPDVNEKQRMFLSLDTEREVFFGGSVGGGKAQPYGSLVCTPKGFVTLGSLGVGDKVTDPTTGGHSEVLAVYEQGEQAVYRVTFDDGASTLATGDHFWIHRSPGNIHRRPRTKRSSQREYASSELGSTQPSDRWNFYKLGTTESIREMLSVGIQCRVPLSEPAVFTINGRTGTGPVPPYLAGLMLGDGSFGSFDVTTGDDEIRDYVLSLGFEPVNGSPLAYRAKGGIRNGLRAWAKNHGLYRTCRDYCRSWEKFLPRYVLTSPLEYRVEFLRGLMDSDGTVDERGRCYFSSTSLSLANGVAAIVRSLGGKARIKGRQTHFTSNGERKAGRPSYTVRVWLHRSKSLFRLERKRVRCGDDGWSGGHELTRQVVSIESEGVQQCRCIKVSSPHGLYLTDDYIVTHNSIALFIAALQYVDRPNYSAVIFRRTFTDLSIEGGLIPVSHQHLGQTDARWNGSMKKWTFPSGAVIAFAYMDTDDTRFRYQSARFDYVAWDEVTHFKSPEPYTYLFSRVRRDTGSDIPPRIRAASNPSPVEWVKDRFVPDEYNKSDPATRFSRPWRVETECDSCMGKSHVPGDPDEPCPYCDGGVRRRLFVPSRLEDNQFVDEASYRGQLAELSHVERLRLERGDWLATDAGNVFFRKWFRYYRWQGDPAAQSSRPHIIRTGEHLGRDGVKLLPGSQYQFFATADTASKVKTQNDPTVICVWWYDPVDHDLGLVDVFRDWITVPEILPEILTLYHKWGCDFVMIEDASSGIGVIQEARTARGQGINVAAYNPHTTDKISRATPAQIRMESGQIYLPVHHPLLDVVEAELLGFCADPDQHDDIVDNFSMAAHYVSNRREYGGFGSTSPTVPRASSNRITPSGPPGIIGGRSPLEGGRRW